MPGSILAWPLTGLSIAQAREAIEQGRRAAGRTDRHQLAGGTPISGDPDPDVPVMPCGRSSPPS